MKLLSELPILTLLATAVAVGPQPAPRREAPSPPAPSIESGPKPAESAAPGAAARGTVARSDEAPAEGASPPPASLLLGGDWGQLVDRPAAERREGLTPQDIEIRIVVTKDISPQAGERLEVLCDRDPETCVQRLLDFGDKLDGLVDLRQRDKNLYDKKILALKIDAEVDRLARELRAARRAGHTADEAPLMERLRFNIRLQIALGHDARRAYLCQLRELVEQLEKELEHDVQNLTDEAVEERIAALLREPDRTAVPAAAPPE